MNDMAKVFWTGRSQAVRLPKAYRFDGKEVRISREGDKVVLQAVEEDGWAWIRRLRPLDDDAVAAGPDPPRPRQEAPGPEMMPDGPKFDD